MSLSGLFSGGIGMLPFGNQIDSFLHPEKGFEKAGEEMEKYYQDAQGNLRPYNEQGLNQYQRLMEQANALNNPEALQNKWASGYNESPAAQALFNKSREAGLGAASQMGLMGSSAALNNIQQSGSDIMQNDRQNYMNDLMQKYLTSIGIGQNIYNTGASAANTMSQNAMNQGQNMGAAIFGKTNAPGEMFGNFLGKGINAGINYATGGMSSAA